jgi:hypothetical protein
MTLPAVHAQTVARNIGRPTQKLLSYVPSTIPSFGGFEVAIENFEFKACKLGANSN